MLPALPTSPEQFMTWSWAQYQPYVTELVERPLSAENMHDWLTDWSDLSRRLSETYQRLYVAMTSDTTDKQVKQRYNTYMDDIYPNMLAAEQALKEKLLTSGMQPAGFEIPLRNMRSEADVFRQANLPLLSKELKLAMEYDAIIGAQVVDWEGKETTISQLRPLYLDENRELRERAWRLASGRQLADRPALNELWGRLLSTRQEIAANADLPDYRAYRWKTTLRFDYTPADCARFRQAIEQVIVPAASRIYERRRKQLGVESLRPWDLDVDPLGRPQLKPYQSVAELEEKAGRMLERTDPQLGSYYQSMRKLGLLDLENRKGKAPGAYCTNYDFIRLPYIFENAVGVHDDVATLLHESGHAFHVFESARLPYIQQLQIGMEAAELASMSMELLTAAYLPASEGGFYTAEEAARARIDHLEGMILFWPYMAVVDGFQHWVYENPAAAGTAANCDATWLELWERFMAGVDWSGLEEVCKTGWHRKLHIFEVPFYYVEYGLAQLGAVQVWRNSLQDKAGAVSAYRRALALGGTVTLPKLYQTAGVRFAFDAEILQEALSLMESTIEALSR